MSTRADVAVLRTPAASKAAVPLARLFKALGDPLRLLIMRLLRQDSLSVSELCDVLEIRQSALSHHLKVLVEAGLLVRRKEGTAVFYLRALSNTERAGLLDEALAAIDGTDLDDRTQLGLQRIQRQREANSRTFFELRSDHFSEQQELIASWQDYAQASLHLIGRRPDLAQCGVLEVGPGDGKLLPELSARAATVIGLDNAKPMLDLARQAGADRTNIQYILGDTASYRHQGDTVDIVVANMVLHHTPDPASVIKDMAALLNGGGWLVISELCQHDQGWAREHCGDLWLGFEPDQLTRWAKEAGLESCAQLLIAQRNGFQVQVRQFERPARP